jgi:hypothetical protein
MDTEDSTPLAFKEFNNFLIKIKTIWQVVIKWIRMAWAWVYMINVEETSKVKLCSTVWELKEVDQIWTSELKTVWGTINVIKLKFLLEQLIVFLEAV